MIRMPLVRRQIAANMEQSTSSRMHDAMCAASALLLLLGSMTFWEWLHGRFPTWRVPTTHRTPGGRDG